MIKKTGILLVNLGTPDSPNNGDVYKYLIEFLTDARVIDFPWLSRQLLVRSIIVPSRYKNSAKTYREVWDKDRGSPLLYHTQDLTEKVRQRLDSEQYMVEFAMRYQSPNLKSVLEKFQAAQVNKIIVLPLFPQYSSACNGSVIQKVQEITSKWLIIPDISFIHHFYDHELYIDAFVEQGRKHNFEEYDHILFSYHGLPERHITKADLTKKHCLQSDTCCSQITETNQHCYRAQCYATTRLIVEKLGLPKEKYTVTFQSRLGKEAWIQPYTTEVITRLAKEGKKKILFFSPAFVADCLETIYEIKTEYLELFQQHGGEAVGLVESLNATDKWADAVVDLVTK
jgi:ferrochelatase